MQFALETVGVGEPGGARLSGLDQDLVVDVGDIGDHGDFVAAPGEPAAQDVKDDLFANVPEVRPGLHGEAAVVDRHLTGDQRIKGADRPRGCVMQPECAHLGFHSGSLSSAISRRNASIPSWSAFRSRRDIWAKYGSRLVPNAACISTSS